MIVPSCLVCSIVPLAAACGSHGTLSLLVMETCVHDAVYALPFFFFFFISVTQSAYRLFAANLNGGITMCLET